MTARGRIEPRDGSATIEPARIELGDGAVALGFTARREADGSARAEGALEPVELDALRALLRGLVEDPIPDYALAGRLDGSFSGRREPSGGWNVAGALALAEAGFSSQDGTRVVQNAAARGRFDVEGGAGAALHGRLDGTLTGPVLLWGTLFGDYSPIVSEIALTVNHVGGGWQATADWSLPRGATVVARLHSATSPAGAALDDAQVVERPDGGPTSGEPLRWALAIGVPDLGSFLDNYVRTPFEGSVEGIDALRASGVLGIDVSGELGDARRTVEGTVSLVSASFSGIDGTTRVGALDLALPIDLRWTAGPDGEMGKPMGERREGTLAFAELAVRGLALPPVATRLAVEGDTVRLAEDVRLDVLDGTAELEGLSIVDWSGRARAMRFGLRLDGLELGRLAETVGFLPLEGRLDGFFPAVRVTADEMAVEGGGEIDIFGGRVRVFDIAGENVLSRFPRLRFSADFTGIHLIEVTRKFDFGEIHGVVEGDVRDCELFRGIPVRCAARVESVKTPGVPQRINVKAVRNIAIIGAGGSPGLLDRGIHRFLDS
jgi:hypothetical protein